MTGVVVKTIATVRRIVSNLFFMPVTPFNN